MIFNVNVSGKEIWEIEHHDVQKKIKLRFEIGLSVNETQLKRTTRNETFLKLLLILVYIMETGTDRTGAFYKIILWMLSIIVTLFAHFVYYDIQLTLWYSVNKNE